LSDQRGSIARRTASVDASPSAILSRQARRDGLADDRHGHISDWRRPGSWKYLFATAHVAGTDGPQVTKLQFEIVAVLGLLALFTHIHLFWIAGLMLALVDLPDFGTPLGRIAGSVERIADSATDKDVGRAEDEVKAAEAEMALEKMETNLAKESTVPKRGISSHV